MSILSMLKKVIGNRTIETKPRRTAQETQDEIEKKRMRDMDIENRNKKLNKTYKKTTSRETADEVDRKKHLKIMQEIEERFKKEEEEKKDEKATKTYRTSNKRNQKVMKNKEIAKMLNISVSKIIDIFIELDFIERRKGLVATKKGLLAGATDNRYMGKNYILWKTKILENEEFKQKVIETKNQKPKTSYKRKKQIGDEYEIQIGKFYEDLDYKVTYRGIAKGKKDEGIDLIAEDENEILLIQCKNNQNTKITQGKLKEFLGNCFTYKEKNIKTDKKIRKIFTIAKNNIDYGTRKYIKANKEYIEFEIIPFKNA